MTWIGWAPLGAATLHIFEELVYLLDGPMNQGSRSPSRAPFWPARLGAEEMVS